jgi:hypothetical protein
MLELGLFSFGLLASRKERGNGVNYLGEILTVDADRESEE